jgi:amylosucrase
MWLKNHREFSLHHKYGPFVLIPISQFPFPCLFLSHYPASVFTMSLSPEQQERAARAYIKEQLNTTRCGSEVLRDTDFLNRLNMNFITIFGIFTELYGYRNDCLDQLVDLITMLAHSWRERPKDLKEMDRQRELDPEWYVSNKMVGGVCYVDRYAENLDGIRAKIPYFKELGLTYLHLMPLFDCPDPLSDGGYAVSNYRKVKPALGNIDELRDLATELRREGISLVLDMVFNHTSDEHEWARKAKAGDPEYSSYYWIFPDRNIPQAFEEATREIFP